MTTEKDKISYNTLDGYSCSVWLDRSYNDLLKCRLRLKSYLFEPTTIKQFEIREKLQDKLSTILDRSMHLLKILKRNPPKFIGVDEINNHLHEAKQMENDIYNYEQMLKH